MAKTTIKLRVLDFFNTTPDEYSIMQIANTLKIGYVQSQHAMNALMAEGLLERRLVGALYYYKAVIPK